MATSKSNDKQQRDLRLNLADLEAMSTHQIADLLSNIVLILRRLPDVAASELAQLPTEQQSEPPVQGEAGQGVDFINIAHGRVNGHSLPGWAGKDKQQ